MIYKSLKSIKLLWAVAIIKGFKHLIAKITFVFGPWNKMLNKIENMNIWKHFENMSNIWKMINLKFSIGT